MQGFNTTSSTMTNLIGIAAQALPITGLVEGAITGIRGGINLGLNLVSLMSSRKKTYEEGFLPKFALNIFETAQGTILVHYGRLALQTGSSVTMFQGFLIARAISLLGDIVSLIQEMNKLESNRTDLYQRQQTEKKCLDVLFKAIEVAGWGLLMAGAPIGGIFLAAALMYQAYKAMTFKTDKAAGGRDVRLQSSYRGPSHNSTDSSSHHEDGSKYDEGEGEGEGEDQPNNNQYTLDNNSRDRQGSRLHSPTRHSLVGSGEGDQRQRLSSSEQYDAPITGMRHGSY
jgi:hypothetical protein